MDFGKIAYQKACEIEKQILGAKDVTGSGLNCFEFNATPDINVSDETTFSIEQIDAETNDVCLFFKIVASAQKNNEGNTSGVVLSVKLLFENMVVCTKNFTISGQKKEVTLSSVASSAITGKGQLSVVFEATATVTIDEINCVGIGAKTNTKSEAIELRAVMAKDNIAISFIANHQLKLALFSPLTTHIDNEKFADFKTAKTHSIAFDNASNRLYVAFVALDGNLFLTYRGASEDVFIESGVTSVCVQSSCDPDESGLIVAYIKSGKAFYRWVSGAIVSNAVEFNVPDAVYVRVAGLVSEDNKNYIVLTDDTENNYICSSILSSKTGHLMDYLALRYEITLLMYSHHEAIDKLSLDPIISVIDRVFAPKNNVMQEVTTLEFGAFASFEAIDVSEGCLKYGIEVNPNSETPNWDTDVVYIDDCVGFTPASLTGSTSAPVFSAGDWADKWPYVNLRPCILNNGEVTAYLNQQDLTQYADGTSTGINLLTSDPGDIMVEIPKIYYRVSVTQEKKWRFEICNKRRPLFKPYAFMREGKEAEKLYYAMFAASTGTGDVLRSRAGVTKMAVGSRGLDEIKPIVASKGAGWGLPTSYLGTLMGILGSIYLKSISMTQALGKGAQVSTPSTKFNKTGQTLAYPAHTYAYKNTNNNVDRVFNIEGLYSGYISLIDGAYAGKDYLAMFDPYGQKCNKPNNALTDYICMKFDYSSIESCRGTDHLVNNAWGYLPRSSTGEPENEINGFDYSRVRINKLGLSTYRVFMPAQVQYVIGAFSFIIAGPELATRFLSVRLIYAKFKEEADENQST